MIARALGTQDAARGLFDLAKQSGAPMTLAELGMTAADIDRATELACATPYWSPRPIEAEGIQELLTNALVGNRP